MGPTFCLHLNSIPLFTQVDVSALNPFPRHHFLFLSRCSFSANIRRDGLNDLIQRAVTLTLSPVDSWLTAHFPIVTVYLYASWSNVTRTGTVSVSPVNQVYHWGKPVLASSRQFSPSAHQTVHSPIITHPEWCGTLPAGR